ncbi:MAG: cell division protein FtsH, partial [Rhodospirillales bacterium]|nr:cell division protein FtsH [Acetobacter sp.]
YGMSEKLGLSHTGQRQSMFLPGMDGQPMQRDCSEATAREIDEEVKRILADAYGQAEAILREHRDQLERVTKELLQRETLDAAAFRELVGLPPEPPQADPLPTLPEIGGLDGGEPTLSPGRVS